MTARAPVNRLPTLDKYELLEELGHGGMATVYRARDLRLEREVALKLIHKHLRDNAEVRDRFVAEARAVAKLRHPGIVDVYDVSDDVDEERYLVVELIRGRNLRKVLDEHGALPAEVAACIVAVLCDAVQHAHESGVIHRDIKPENVLVDASVGSERPSSPRDASSSSGRGHVRVKLTDFGIAKVLDAQGVTSTGQILGSPAHMAPEQIEGGAIGPWTDVFALGVLLYECMVGHLPFEGANPAQVLRRVLAGAFEPPDVERPEVGGRWGAIVSDALALDPAARPPSAADLARRIDAELEALGIADPRRILDRYFEEPDGCRSELVEALVPRLVARGEAARRRGDVQGAASDLNRALALRPDDLAILKRVSSLTASQEWARRLARVAGLSVGALLVGVGSFALARTLRPRAPLEVVTSPIPEVQVTEAAPSARPEATGALSAVVPPSPPSSASQSVRSGPVATTTPVVARSELEPPRPAPLRKVRFYAVPVFAKLRVDGNEVVWFGRVLELPPGSHNVVGYVSDDRPCCTETNLTIHVTDPPADHPDEEQSFKLALGFRPARVSLVGGPPDARAVCGNGLVFGTGADATKQLGDLERSTTCTFLPSNRKRSVVLRAGEATLVPWSE